MKLMEEHPGSDGTTAKLEARRSSVLGVRVKAYRTARRLTLRHESGGAKTGHGSGGIVRPRAE
ncbi:hypothetical protein C7441_1071 [Pseudaminobacter salicylatoxidans]|uniref:Uncharacterized protein n=1 Tax=Pseudaminobacter salicylatoxidans TaxID=93369 RepID=A0A316C3L7_PSESE|nr:hypothetical protein [Pseudaminobacter salicylatoxidans]PWJ83843.1 hypothetical protein C7441_1071 [Pseudaminobacter salicylatoxidans]